MRGGGGAGVRTRVNAERCETLRFAPSLLEPGGFGARGGCGAGGRDAGRCGAEPERRCGAFAFRASLCRCKWERGRAPRSPHCAALRIAVPGERPRKAAPRARIASGCAVSAGRCRKEPQRGAHRRAARRPGARLGGTAALRGRAALRCSDFVGRGCGVPTPGAAPERSRCIRGDGAQSCRPVGCQLRPRSGAGVVWGRGLLPPLSIVCVQSPKWRPGGAGGEWGPPRCTGSAALPAGTRGCSPRRRTSVGLCSLGGGVWRGLIVLSGEQRDSSPGGVRSRMGAQCSVAAVRGQGDEVLSAGCLGNRAGFVLDFSAAGPGEVPVLLGCWQLQRFKGTSELQ